ncbi:MAG: SigE family polymerase sigma factor [Acidimicrobiales bacterium]|nr:SigE family polymerase sigma factor [Acidimicrobiales bacterium]
MSYPGDRRAGREDDDPETVAFNDFYRREYGDAVRLARLLLRDWSRAEEIAQEAFLRVLAHPEATESRGGYLRTIVVNLCRDHHRRIGRARGLPHGRALDAAPPGIPETSAAVWLALLDLPDRQREAIALRFYLDLSTHEISRILNVRPASVRSLIHRGLAALKQVVPHD